MRARLIVPLVVLCCALVAAPAALAFPHLSKAQKRMVSNLVERWVNDMVRGRDLADGWKIAGEAERGAIPRKEWVSGRQVPVMKMEVRNNPRTSWYALDKDGDEIFLNVALKTGHGKHAELWNYATTLQKRHGRWLVYAFYVDGIFRLGKGHSGSCASSDCKVTGLADYMAGGPVSPRDLPPTEARVGGHWLILVYGVILGLPFFGLLALGLLAFKRSRDARRARIAYEASRDLARKPFSA